MPRRAHYIRPNTRSETPHRAIWLDTETHPVPLGPDKIGHALTFGWASFRRTRAAGQWTATEWLRFEDKKDLWYWVDTKVEPKTTTYLFCHNTSFDLPVLDAFHELPKRGWKMSRAVLDAPPTIITFRRGAARLEILDTLNIWRMPLKTLGDMVGLPKLDMPATDADPSLWDRYGRRDTEIIMKACLEWWEWLRRSDMGGFAPTLAAQSLRTWRHKYMSEHVLVHDSAPLLAMEREAYHGGRVECFRIGEYRQRLHLLDVNSLYPAVMQSGHFPVSLAFHRFINPKFPWRETSAGHCIIARCTLRTSVPAYPYLSDGKLVFPVGEFRATLCGPEIEYAADNGHLCDISEIAVYKQAPIFRSFVDELYAQRIVAKQSGDTARAGFLKILMNSLYGKFGQRGDTWSDDGETDDLTARTWLEVDASTRTPTRYRQLGGLRQVQRREPESRESCPAIAAYVTSLARIYLWRLALVAGQEHVYYVDTDSLVVDDEGYGRLSGQIDPSRLGALKDEGAVDYAVFHGPKDYVWGHKFRLKGVRQNGIWRDPHTVIQDRWRGLRGQIQDGIVDMPTTERVTKHISRRYTKGTPQASGVVLPLVLGAVDRETAPPPAGGGTSGGVPATRPARAACHRAAANTGAIIPAVSEASASCASGGEPVTSSAPRRWTRLRRWV